MDVVLPGGVPGEDCPPGAEPVAGDVPGGDCPAGAEPVAGDLPGACPPGAEAGAGDVPEGDCPAGRNSSGCCWGRWLGLKLSGRQLVW